MGDYDAINRANCFYHFIEIAPVTTLVSGILWGIIFYQSLVICLYQDWGNMHS